VAFADAAASVLARELLESLEDARAAASLGAYAFDVLANLPLPADRAAQVVADWAFLERSLTVGGLNDDADAARESATKADTVTTLGNPLRRRGNHRPATRRHRLALAGSAALLVGDLCDVPAASTVVQALAPALLRCVDAPLRIIKCGDRKRDVAAACGLAHNACWALGQFFQRCRERPFLLKIARRLLTLVVADGLPAHLRQHAALLLGRGAANLDAILPDLARALEPWLAALAANGDADTADLVHCFTVVCAIASRDLRCFMDTRVGPALLAALAAWRHCQPPVPPPELGLSLKRLLHHLQAQGALRLSPDDAALRPGDFEYLLQLYG